MNKLESVLGEWVRQGFITPDQAARIRTFENEKPQRSWVMSGILILGATIVGIGVISMIAANWEWIPDWLKLACDFLLLGGVGLALYRVSEAKREILFDAILTGFMIIVIASIGLISQIFHTGGEPYQALLLWCVLTFGLTLVARHFFPPFLWAGGLLAALALASWNRGFLHFLFNEDPHALAMTFPLVCGAVAMLSRRLMPESPYSQAFRWWMFFTGFAAIVVAEVWGRSMQAMTGPVYIGYLAGYGAAIVMLVGLVLTQSYNRIQKLMLTTAIVSFVMLFQVLLLRAGTSIVMAGLTILTLSSIAVFMAGIHARRIFQFLLFVIGIRFLILYFQALGGLAMTGLGLIVSGGLVIGAAIVWNKYRRPLASWAERLSS